MTQTNKLKAIELFAGIGGFRLGMKAANIDTIWANDISELCCQVYQSNFGNNSIILDDINQINLSEIPEHDIKQLFPWGGCKVLMADAKVEISEYTLVNRR